MKPSDAEQLKRAWTEPAKQPPLTLTISPHSAFLLIGQLRLARTHPHNAGINAAVAAAMMEALRAAMGPEAQAFLAHSARALKEEHEAAKQRTVTANMHRRIVQSLFEKKTPAWNTSVN